MKQVLLLLLFSIDLLAQAQITFQNAYSSSKYPSVEAYSVMQTSDSGYILTGVIGDSISDHILLIKTNAHGDTLWTKTYGNSNEGNSVQQTFDGGYIITGFSDFNIYLLKTNGNGDSLWTKTYNCNSDYGGVTVEQTSDSGYIIGGSTVNLGSGGYDLILIKTDKYGDTLWSKCYGTYDTGINGGPNDDLFHDMQQTKDGGYIIAGARFLHSNSTQTALVIKTDSVGNPIWSNVYGNASDIHAYHAAQSIQQTMDGGYIIDDHTGGTPNLFKIGPSGQVLWIKYNSAGPYGPVIPTKDGGYIMTGGGEMIKTDSMGDTLWTKSYGKYLGLNSIEQTNDGGFILSGLASDSSGNIVHCALIKTDPNGNSTCNVPPFPFPLIGNGFIQIVDTAIIVTDVTPLLIDSPSIVSSAALLITSCSPLAVNEILIESSIVIYPNPANDQLTIHTSSIHNESSTISVMNLLGQIVQEEKIKWSTDISLNIKDLSAGIYFLQLSNETQRVVLKFVKE